jgi:Lon protease-like protein
VPTRRLPLFPLPLVLFPGAPLPLHIFEPRYREMLADLRAGDGRFGMILVEGEPERSIPAGRVGCEAELREVRMRPDGRADILVSGVQRFALERFVDAAHAYHVALVSDYDDLPDSDSAAVTVAADRARATFARIAVAAATVADEPPRDVELPDDPALLAFRIASLVDFDRAQCQALLESRSALARLLTVESALHAALPHLEARAATHSRARLNGHGPSGQTGAA